MGLWSAQYSGWGGDQSTWGAVNGFWERIERIMNKNPCYQIEVRNGLWAKNSGNPLPESVDSAHNQPRNVPFDGAVPRRLSGMLQSAHNTSPSQR
jgi:hypothetical protein